MIITCILDRKISSHRKLFKLLLKFLIRGKMAEDEYNEEKKEEENVYDEESREELVESGEMSPEEAGFMKGYEEAEEEKKEKEEKEDEEEKENEEE